MQNTHKESEFNLCYHKCFARAPSSIVDKVTAKLIAQFSERNNIFNIYTTQKN